MLLIFRNFVLMRYYLSYFKVIIAAFMHQSFNQSRFYIVVTGTSGSLILLILYSFNLHSPYFLSAIFFYILFLRIYNADLFSRL